MNDLEKAEDDFEVTGMFNDGVIEVHRKSTDEYRRFVIGELLHVTGAWKDDPERTAETTYPGILIDEFDRLRISRPHSEGQH